MGPTAMAKRISCRAKQATTGGGLSPLKPGRLGWFAGLVTDLVTSFSLAGFIKIKNTVNDRFSGDRYNGNDRFSGLNPSDKAILLTVNLVE